METHLAECGACRGLLEDFRQDDRLLHATVGARVKVDERINEGVWRRIEQADRSKAALRPARPTFRSVLGGTVGRLRLPTFQTWAVCGGLAAAALLIFFISRFTQPGMGSMDVRVASIGGTALWSPAESGLWQPLKAGMVLHAGDRLRTVENGKLTALWKDGSRAIPGSGGEGSVLHLLPGLELKRGRLYAEIKKDRSKETPFTVRSSEATAQVVGTKFQIEVLPERHETLLAVYQGAVYLMNKKGSVVARDWTSAEVVGGSAPTIPHPISPLAASAMWWVRK